MNKQSTIVFVFCATATAACSPRILNFPPPDGGVTQSPQCLAGNDWLPVTPPVTLDTPPPHPESECPFFQDSFQQFLIATQPDSNGEPALASYATIDDAFTRLYPLPAGALAPAGAHRGTSTRAWLGDVAANNLPMIPIDQDGHALYYGTHLDQAFAYFVRSGRLATARAVQALVADVALPAGIVELRSAWKDIDPADGVTGDYSDFITTTAWVSHLSKDATGTIVEDRDHPRQIRVALVALHVGFTLPGHPELISATFEHVGSDGNTDTAPTMVVNPSPEDPNNAQTPDAPAPTDFLLYHAGTPANQANTAIAEADLHLDEATQSFGAQTSIYRMYPASRSNTTAIDDDVTSLNRSVAAAFARNAAALDPRDKRGHYRLVGALWLDKPSTFSLDSSLQNDFQSPFVVGPHTNQDGQSEQAVPLPAFVDSIRQWGTASPFSIQGGHDRLSSTAVESFTQAPGSFNNCLTCHNTRAVSVTGVPFVGPDPGDVRLLNAGLLNVSRVFFQFVREECYDPINIATDANGDKVVVCP